MSETSPSPWRSDIVRALYQNKSRADAKYFQLATVSPMGLPSCRTVVFRGFEANSNNIIIHTDSRSVKISHIEHNPQVEICWYFPNSREQFRVVGKAIIIDGKSQPKSLRNHHWHNLSNSAKSAYFQAEPGSILGLNDQHQAVVEHPGDMRDAPDQFVLLSVIPDQVEHLQLKPNPHKRLVYHLQHDQVDHQWLRKEIHP